MRTLRHLVVTLTAVVVLASVGGCAQEQRWEQRGFDSEAECWMNHGWDGSVSDGVNRNAMFDYWCGPIEDD